MLLRNRNSKDSYHVVGHFQLRSVCIVNKDVETFLCNVTVQSVAWNVSIGVLQ